MCSYSFVIVTQQGICCMRQVSCINIDLLLTLREDMLQSLERMKDVDGLPKLVSTLTVVNITPLLHV